VGSDQLWSELKSASLWLPGEDNLIDWGRQLVPVLLTSLTSYHSFVEFLDTTCGDWWICHLIVACCMCLLHGHAVCAYYMAMLYVLTTWPCTMWQRACSSALWVWQSHLLQSLEVCLCACAAQPSVRHPKPCVHMPDWHPSRQLGFHRLWLSRSSHGGD